MAKKMKASEFVKRVKDVATNYKTLYVMGCIGAPLTTANKKRYTTNHSYNKAAARVKMINKATPDTFGFDCVCLIKSILWGWNGDRNTSYGGARYGTNGVPDVNADKMIQLCYDVSTIFDDNIEVGEALWTNGHIGVYIGDGLAVECTPAWKNCVQITACNKAKAGYPTRKWKKHGKLPYIDYSDVKEPVKETGKETSETAVKPARKFDSSIASSYKVVATNGLHIRSGAGKNYESLDVLPNGTVVRNYGYYDLTDTGVKWLYVTGNNGIIGYCSARYLKKV